MPIRFTSSTWCHCSSLPSATVPWAPMPALFTTMSIPPQVACTCSTAELTLVWSVTSARSANQVVVASPGMLPEPGSPAGASAEALAPGVALPGASAEAPAGLWPGESGPVAATPPAPVAPTAPTGASAEAPWAPSPEAPRISRSRIATRAPPSCNLFATAAPIPDAPPVTTATSPANSLILVPSSQRRVRVEPTGLGAGSGLRHFGALTAQGLDLHFHHVPGLQVREPAGQRPPLRGIGADHTAGVHCHVLAQVPHDVVHAEDHVRGTGVLPRLAADPAAQVEVLRVDLIGGDQMRADRGKPGCPLALGPLAAGDRELEVALGEVVHGDEAGDVLAGLRGGVQVQGAR